MPSDFTSDEKLKWERAGHRGNQVSDINKRVIYLGGNKALCLTSHKNFFEIDYTSREFTMLPPLITAIDGFGVAKEFADRYVYIAGGFYYRKKLTWASYYDMELKIWSKMKDMNHPKFWPGMFISED